MSNYLQIILSVIMLRFSSNWASLVFKSHVGTSQDGTPQHIGSPSMLELDHLDYQPALDKF